MSYFDDLPPDEEPTAGLWIAGVGILIFLGMFAWLICR